jgi:hypothetical protein
MSRSGLGVWTVRPWAEPPKYTRSRWRESAKNISLKLAGLAAANLVWSNKTRQVEGGVGYAIECPFCKYHSTSGGLDDTSTMFFEGGKYAGRIVCLHASCDGRRQEEFWAEVGRRTPQAAAQIDQLEDPGVERLHNQLGEQGDGVTYLPIDEARVRLDDAVRGSLVRNRGTLIDATAGLGKSTVLAAHMAKSEDRIGYTTNTHANLDQFAANIISAGRLTKRYRGVGQVKDAQGAHECFRFHLFEAAYEAAVRNPAASFCPPCPVVTTCTIKKPVGQDIPIAPHAMMDSVKGSGLFVVDEIPPYILQYEYPADIYEQAVLSSDQDEVARGQCKRPDVHWAAVKACRAFVRMVESGDDGARMVKRFDKDGHVASVMFAVRHTFWKNLGREIVAGAHLPIRVLLAMTEKLHIPAPYVEVIRVQDKGDKEVYYSSQGNRKALVPNGAPDYTLFQRQLELAASRIEQRDAREILLVTYKRIVTGIEEGEPGSQKCAALLAHLRATRTVHLHWYGGLKGSNDYLTVDACVSIADPWINVETAGLEVAMLHVPEDMDWGRRRCAEELMQVHGRARNVNRSDHFAWHLHIGQVAPLDWTDDDVTITQGPKGGKAHASDLPADTARAAVDAVVQAAGSVASAARALGITPQHVCRCRRTGRIGKALLRTMNLMALNPFYKGIRFILTSPSEEPATQYVSADVPLPASSSVLTSSIRDTNNVEHETPGVGASIPGPATATDDAPRVLGAVPGLQAGDTADAWPGRDAGPVHDRPDVGRRRLPRDVAPVLGRARRARRGRVVGPGGRLPLDSSLRRGQARGVARHRVAVPTRRAAGGTTRLCGVHPPVDWPGLAAVHRPQGGGARGGGCGPQRAGPHGPAGHHRRLLGPGPRGLPARRREHLVLVLVRAHRHQRRPAMAARTRRSIDQDSVLTSRRGSG